MAIFLPILGKFRGSVGGNTFSHNKGGDYVKIRATPTNPQSDRQLDIRTLMATWSGAWEDLTAGQRIAWDTWASENPRDNPLGGTYELTGHQAYVGFQVRLADAEKLPTTSPPVNPSPNELNGFDIAITGPSQITVTFNPGMAALESLMVWMGAPAEGVRNPSFKQGVLVGYSAENVASPIIMVLPVEITDGYRTNFWACILDGEGQVGVVKKDRVLYTAP